MGVEVRAMREDWIDGVAGKRVPDNLLIDAYQRLGSVHKVAREVGLDHASVHERLVRLGLNKPVGRGKGVFTEEDRERLRQDYLKYRNEGRAKELAQEMGRTPQFLAREARALGLTNYRHPRKNLAVWKYMDERQAAIIWNRFKTQAKGLGAFCRKYKLDDLGFSRTMRKFFGDEYEHVLELKVPKTSLYRRGRALEYRVRDDLRDHYRYFVLRSPASRSPIDLCAIRFGEVLFIQCKRAGALPVKEWNALLEMARSCGAHALLAVPHDSGRGLIFFRLLDFKDGSKRGQPMESWQPANDQRQERLFDAK
jgi:Holliday junction resolvase